MKTLKGASFPKLALVLANNNGNGILNPASEEAG